MAPSFVRIAWLGIALALGLAGCLSSDAPNLSADDLTEPPGFTGSYIATAFPETVSNESPDALVEAIGERTYRLTFSEGERKDAPVLVRLITLNDRTLLGVITDPDPGKGAIYATVSHAANGAWVFRSVDLNPAKRDRSLREALMRHGATGVTFDAGDTPNDQIKGALTAANLRALFADPDFSSALESRSGFRLSPSTARVSSATLR